MELEGPQRELGRPRERGRADRRTDGNKNGENLPMRWYHSTSSATVPLSKNKGQELYSIALTHLHSTACHLPSTRITRMQVRT